jgi:hypothetical protein
MVLFDTWWVASRMPVGGGLGGPSRRNCRWTRPIRSEDAGDAVRFFTGGKAAENDEASAGLANVECRREVDVIGRFKRGSR